MACSSPQEGVSQNRTSDDNWKKFYETEKTVHPSEKNIFWNMGNLDGPGKVHGGGVGGRRRRWVSVVA